VLLLIIFLHLALLFLGTVEPICFPYQLAQIMLSFMLHPGGLDKAIAAAAFFLRVIIPCGAWTKQAQTFFPALNEWGRRFRAAPALVVCS
jgi:hypothetical protein